LVDKHFHLFFCATLFLALIIRVLALLSLKNSIYFDYLLWDERIYHRWAMQIVDGTFLSTSVYEMPPLPAYLIALIYRVFSPSILYIRFLYIIFGVCTCHLVYLIAKEMADRKKGKYGTSVARLVFHYLFLVNTFETVEVVTSNWRAVSARVRP
jgi:4-amino-4-deoxy-L-arabinose transferase-like glycosyltransferase